jgi:hypothetical protein
LDLVKKLWKQDTSRRNRLPHNLRVADLLWWRRRFRLRIGASL